MSKNKVTTPPKTTEDWASQYGAQAALVNSDPQLKSIFDQAVAEEWTPARFQASFQNSDWYKNHAQSWRDAETARITDPGTWNQSISNLSDQIRLSATNMGITLDDAAVAKLAIQTAYTSWGKGVDTNAVRSHVIEYGKITGSGGEVAQTVDKLKNYAYSMGVKYSDDWYNQQAESVLSGKATIDESSSAIKDIAKSKYAAFASQIDAGSTVMQVASPYINSMANILEMDPNTISLDDPHLNKALTGLNKDSQPVLSPLWQFETQLRKDPRWGKTQNARQATDSAARSILQSFGLVS